MPRASSSGQEHRAHVFEPLRHTSVELSISLVTEKIKEELRDSVSPWLARVVKRAFAKYKLARIVVDLELNTLKSAEQKADPDQVGFFV